MLYIIRNTRTFLIYSWNEIIWLASQKYYVNFMMLLWKKYTWPVPLLFKIFQFIFINAAYIYYIIMKYNKFLQFNYIKLNIKIFFWHYIYSRIHTFFFLFLFIIILSFLEIMHFTLVIYIYTFLTSFLQFIAIFLKLLSGIHVFNNIKEN